MDLAYDDVERAFAEEARLWLAEHLVAPPHRFATIEDEIAWGREWQATLAADRWVGIAWPARYGGRDATPVQVALFNMEYARAGAPQPVNRVGINLAGPTLLAHGSDAQKAKWLARILDASEIWCQLFSEPDAGSDLASLKTRAVAVDGGWLVSGQKVWTSYAQFARWGICLARTDVGAAKHRGISYLVIDMQAPGIEIRPLVQITGEAEFNEVFMDEVFVPSEHLVGGLNNGWAVANTTLAHERGTNFPFKEQVVHEVFLEQLLRQAAANRALDREEVSDALVQAFVELRVLRLHNWRTLSRLGRGFEPGPESSWIKLAWTNMTQHLSAAALDVIGDESVLWFEASGSSRSHAGDLGIDPDGEPDVGRWPRQWLWSQAASIAGGTSEVQKNIIAERILGLPRDP